MSNRSAHPVVYRIDAGDMLVEVNDAWRAFALENGAPSLADGAVGTSLWAAIDGAELRHVWGILLDRARAGAPVDVPYRCDGPGMRRHMRMTMRGFPDGGVEFVSRILDAEPREPVPTDELLRACSWCNRFHVGEWLEPEDATERAGLLGAAPPPITHGICEDCRAEVMRGVAGAPSTSAC